MELLHDNILATKEVLQLSSRELDFLSGDDEIILREVIVCVTDISKVSVVYSDEYSDGIMEKLLSLDEHPRNKPDEGGRLENFLFVYTDGGMSLVNEPVDEFIQYWGTLKSVHRR